MQEYISEGSKYTMEIDLKDYFDTIPHEQMMSLIKERITDDRVVDLIYKYMHCSVSQDNEIKEKKKGLVQGNAISTVLSNLYLHSLDNTYKKRNTSGSVLQIILMYIVGKRVMRFVYIMRLISISKKSCI